MNSDAMLVIFPYRYNDTWVFDDQDAGLAKEPFVSGIPPMIDRLVEQISNANQ